MLSPLSINGALGCLTHFQALQVYMNETVWPFKAASAYQLCIELGLEVLNLKVFHCENLLQPLSFQ